MSRYFGKYRATVLDNVDPMQMGRLMVQVPDVSNVIPSSWALPCLPFAGVQNGFFVTPSVGSGVWVEFEQGDPDYPIWVGCFWGSASDVPSAAQAAPPGIQQVVMQTMQMNLVVISDVPGPTGGILLQSTSGASIAINDVGITIDNGQGASIVMTGPSISVNQGALQVV